MEQPGGVRSPEACGARELAHVREPPIDHLRLGRRAELTRGELRELPPAVGVAATPDLEDE